MSFNRRSLLGGLAVGAAAPTVARAAGRMPQLVHPRGEPPAARGPLVDRARAAEVMARDGLSGIIVSDPVNLYYFTGVDLIPFMRSLVLDGLAFGLVPRDPTQPVGIVLNSFGLYHSYSPALPDKGVAVFQFDAQQAPGIVDPSNTAGVLTGGRMLKPGELISYPNAHETPDTPLDVIRNSRTREQAAKWGIANGMADALGRATRALGMTSGTIACDCPVGSPQWLELQRVCKDATLQGATPTISRIRVVKSPQEVSLMRYAAAANAAAATTAARAVHAGANSRELRETFFAEAAKRGGLGAWIAIDGVSVDAYCQDFKRGHSFMIDAVSTYGGYHGDFGRTVFVGEPRGKMRAHTDAIQDAWSAVRERMRPGLRFSEIQEIGRESLRRAKVETDVRITPHSIGLLHTDAGGIGDIALEPGMIISVDFPVLEAGIGGSAHLEDLTLITHDGHELLNAATDPTIQV